MVAGRAVCCVLCSKGPVGWLVLLVAGTEAWGSAEWRHRLRLCCYPFALFNYESQRHTSDGKSEQEGTIQQNQLRDALENNLVIS